MHATDGQINEPLLLASLDKICRSPNTIEAARGAVEVMYRLGDYGRVSLVSGLWDEHDWSLGVPVPIVWAAVLKAAHKRGKAGSLLMQNFELYEVEEMFRAALPGVAGFYVDGDPMEATLTKWRKRRIYRGGSQLPEKLARGISWTLSHDEAKGFSRRMADIYGGTPIVISTLARRRDVLAVFEHEQEVVLWTGDRDVNVLES